MHYQRGEKKKENIIYILVSPQPFPEIGVVYIQSRFFQRGGESDNKVKIYNYSWTKTRMVSFIQESEVETDECILFVDYKYFEFSFVVFSKATKNSYHQTLISL